MSNQISYEFLRDEILKDLREKKYQPKRGLRLAALKNIIYKDFEEKYRLKPSQADMLTNAINTAWDIHHNEIFSRKCKERELAGQVRLLTIKQTEFFDYLAARPKRYIPVEEIADNLKTTKNAILQHYRYVSNKFNNTAVQFFVYKNNSIMIVIEK